MDMEMVQYHPTTLAENGFLITEGARGEGAHLLNSEGRRFMEDYAPNKMELASRDVVSRAEQTEINEGRGVGPDGQGIYLDITVVPKQARARGAARDRQHRARLRRHRHHARADHDPPRPALHHGRRQDRRRTATRRSPGLYAAGEVACVSVHGGNRLGANSLLDTLIFGRRSGEHAAARGQDMAMPHGAARRGCARTPTQIDEIIAPRAQRPADLGDQGRARHDDERVRRRLPRRGGPARRRTRSSGA